MDIHSRTPFPIAFEDGRVFMQNCSGNFPFLSVFDRLVHGKTYIMIKSRGTPPRLLAKVNLNNGVHFLQTNHLENLTFHLLLPDGYESTLWKVRAR